MFTALDPVAAITGANALASAYQELASLETTAATVAAIERIDAQIDSLSERFRFCRLADQCNAGNRHGAGRVAEAI